MRRFLTELYTIWISERPDQLAAAIAYYGLFAFAPVIYVAIRVAGIFIDQLQATDRFYLRLVAVLGADAANLVRDSVAALSKGGETGSWLVSLISSVALLFAASGLFYQLQYALNVIWNVPLPLRVNTLEIIRKRLLSFLIAIGLGLLLVFSILTNLMLAWLGSIGNELFGIGDTQILFSSIASIGLTALVYAILYKILPEVKVAWRDIGPGAVLAALLTGIGALVMGMIFKTGKLTSAFEAAGAFAILLVGIYYMAQIFLLGAVFVRVYAQMFGSHRPV